MQTLQISDQAAQQLCILAAQEKVSRLDLIERLIFKYSQDIELRAFLKLYQKDLSVLKFDREEANTR